MPPTTTAAPSIKNLFKFKPKPSTSTTNVPLTTTPTIPSSREPEIAHTDADAISTNELQTRKTTPNASAGVFVSETSVIVELTSPRPDTPSPKLDDTSLKVELTSPKPEVSTPIPEITASNAETASPKAEINHNLKNELDNQALQDTNLPQDSLLNGGTLVSSITCANRDYNEIDGQHVEANVNNTNLLIESNMAIANPASNVTPRLDGELVRSDDNSHKMTPDVIESNKVTYPSSTHLINPVEMPLHETNVIGTTIMIEDLTETITEPTTTQATVTQYRPSSTADELPTIANNPITYSTSQPRTSNKFDLFDDKPTVDSGDLLEDDKTLANNVIESVAAAGDARNGEQAIVESINSPAVDIAVNESPNNNENIEKAENTISVNSNNDNNVADVVINELLSDAAKPEELAIVESVTQHISDMALNESSNDGDNASNGDCTNQQTAEALVNDRATPMLSVSAKTANDEMPSHPSSTQQPGSDASAGAPATVSIAEEMERKNEGDKEEVAQPVAPAAAPIPTESSELAAGKEVPTEMVQAGPLPAEPLPAEPSPAEPLPAEPMPTEPEPVPVQSSSDAPPRATNEEPAQVPPTNNEPAVLSPIDDSGDKVVGNHASSIAPIWLSLVSVLAIRLAYNNSN